MQTNQESPAREDGLLSARRGVGNRETHLYHPTLPPLITYNAKDEADARAKGYGDEYIRQEYPKAIDGKTVNNAEEEAALAQAKKGKGK